MYQFLFSFDRFYFDRSSWQLTWGYWDRRLVETRTTPPKIQVIR
jgi:hypothetical protein